MVDSFAIFPQFFKVILSGQDAQHVVLPLEGGSDNGEFPIVGQKLKSYKVSLKSGKLHEGDVIVEVQVYMGSGWQKQGHTWHIVPRNYSTKVGLIDLIMEKNWGNEEKSRRKIEKSGG